MRKILGRMTGLSVLCLGASLASACADGGPASPEGFEAVDGEMAATSTAVTFVVGPLVPVIDVAVPVGSSGRLRLLGVYLPGPVSGDMEGQFESTIDINFDADFNGRGHGTATISTSDGAWTGRAVASFVGVFFEPAGRNLPLGTMDLTLHGPRGQLLQANCQERLPPVSETLDCTGRVLDPQG